MPFAAEGMVSVAPYLGVVWTLHVVELLDSA